jgi:hypothetical protein
MKKNKKRFIGIIILLLTYVVVIGGPLPSITSIPVTNTEKANFINHLFPLPQEVDIKEVAYSFSPKDFSLEIDSGMSVQAKGYVKAFQQGWNNRYMTELQANTSGMNSAATIYIGTTNIFPPFKTAVKYGVLNLTSLSKVKNAEQGYRITCIKTKKGLNIYIAANKAPGIYNALTTFDQLLSSSNSKSSIVIPKMTLLDWPDIKERGEWGSKLYKTPKRLVEYSKMKLNTYWDPFLRAKLRDGKIRYESKKDLIDKCANLNIQMIPILTHLDCMMRPGYMVYENFRELVGTEGDEKFNNRRPWCFSNPKSQKVLDGIFEAIARDVGTDYLWAWPSEHGYACNCSKCNGDVRMQNIREFKHIMHAYEKAKLIRPNLKMTLITTQGTKGYNEELLDYIPAEVSLDIYDGDLTYKTTIKTPILKEYKPLLNKMRDQGRSIGVVPIFAASHLPGNMLFPFNSALLSKTRMTEFKTEGVERIIGWLPPQFFVQEINGESMAEFAWNVDGRTTTEFLISWAVRKGMNSPEQVAKIIELLDYSERALSRGMRAGRFNRPIDLMVDNLVHGTVNSGYFCMIKAFTNVGAGTKNVSDALVECNEACNLAVTQGDKELITGASLTRQWVQIFALYDEYLNDKSQVVRIRREIASLFEALPDLWEAWIVTQPLSERKLKQRRSVFYDIVDNAIKKLKDSK